MGEQKSMERRLGVTHRMPGLFGGAAAYAWYRRVSKATLAEALMHLCAKETGEYDTALANGDWLTVAESECARAQGTI